MTTDGIGLKLDIVDPNRVRYSRPIREAFLTVGSMAGDCQLRLPDDGLRPHHVTLKFHGDRCVVVRVEGARITIDGSPVDGDFTRLEFGAVLGLGAHRLTILDVGDALADEAAESADVRALQDYRSRVRQVLIERLDLRRRDVTRADSTRLRHQVELLLHRIIEEPDHRLPDRLAPGAFVKELADECLGLGALEDLLGDPEVSEIMVVAPDQIYVERRGELYRVEKRFTSTEALEIVIQRIVRSVGRRIDQAVPMVDARLPDGSRVNAIIPPLAIKGPCLTIRKFPGDALTMDMLCALGSLTPRMARFLERTVKARRNVLVSGGTGSGKTTLLNVLSGFIYATERIVTVEDAAELRLEQEHVVSLETRPPSLEGKGEYTIRDLVRNALRMRPDRIIVGEVRGGEALDMLQAMNTGHAGSMTTVHANSPVEAISRLETLVLLADNGLTGQAVREQIAQSIDLLVQQDRMKGGGRRVTRISEIVGLGTDGRPVVEDIFRFVPTGLDESGIMQGRFHLTGHLPSYLGDLIALGLAGDGEFL